MRIPQLFLLVGPSAAGKSSTLQTLLNRQKIPIRRFITSTTRTPRPGEKNGVDYWFVSEEEFKQDIEQGLFFEHANVYDHLYGSNKRELERLEEIGDPIIMTVDIQGARTIKQSIQNAITIFLDAPRDQLKKRLIERGVENSELEKRLAAIDQEKEFKQEADIIIENGDGSQQQAVEELEREIIKKTNNEKEKTI